MKTLITILLMTVSISIQAELIARYNLDPAEQVVTNNVFQENADLKLKIYAALDSTKDKSGIKLILGYDFRCQGDDVIAQNKDQTKTGSPEMIAGQIEYRLVKPQAWDQWSSGSRVCYLNWTGSAIRTSTQGGTSIAYTIGGLGSSITFTYSPSQASSAEEEGRTSVKSFTMTKPAPIGGFCENIL